MKWFSIIGNKITHHVIKITQTFTKNQSIHECAYNVYICIVDLALFFEILIVRIGKLIRCGTRPLASELVQL